MKDQPTIYRLPPRGNARLRIVLPAVLIGMVSVLLVWGAIRGNWTDASPHIPATAAEGVVTQLVPAAEGRKQIHAAMIINASSALVWKVVTDYDHFSDVFPHISTARGVRDPDGRWHVTGEVRSIVGHWPMDLHVRQEESAAKYIASWDEPSEAWKINRGSWVVTPHGTGETLLEYNLELKVSPFPDFVVRAVLLGELKPVMRAVANQAGRAQPSSR